jgi:hypothetical protein
LIFAYMDYRQPLFIVFHSETTNFILSTTNLLYGNEVRNIVLFNYF